MQLIIITIIIAACIAYALQRVYRIMNSKTNQCEGCEGCELKNRNTCAH